jgi:hypothetical protein
LIEFSLAISLGQKKKKNGVASASSTKKLAQFYCKLARLNSSFEIRKSQLLLAKSYFEEGFQSFTKIYGPTHDATFDASSQLAYVLRQFSSKDLLFLCLIYSNNVDV